MRSVDRAVYGNDFLPQRHLGVGWLLGHERHKSGEPHAHGIVYSMDDLEHVSRSELWRWWFEEWGLNRLEPVRSAHQAVAYTTKYVLKDGDVSFSDNFQHYVRFYGEEEAARSKSSSPAVGAARSGV